MKWWVFGYEKDKRGGQKIIGEVHTVIEDKGYATQTAEIKYGYDAVYYVERASHLEHDNFGRMIVIYE